jgi:hypothetical protein
MGVDRLGRRDCVSDEMLLEDHVKCRADTMPSHGLDNQARKAWVFTTTLGMNSGWKPKEV